MSPYEIIAHLSQQIVALEQPPSQVEALKTQFHTACIQVEQERAEIKRLEARINELEVALNNRDKKVAEAEAIARVATSQLDAIDGILGNCSAFDHCNGRQDKIRLAMQTAAKVDPLEVKVANLDYYLKHNAQTASEVIRKRTGRLQVDDPVLDGINPGDYALQVAKYLEKAEKEIADLKADLKARCGREVNHVWIQTAHHTPFFHGLYWLKMRNGPHEWGEFSNKGWKPRADHDVLSWACTEENVCSLIDDLSAAHRKLEKYRAYNAQLDWPKFEGVEMGNKWTHKGILDSTLDVFSEPGQATVKEVTDYIKVCMENLYEEGV